MLRVRTIYATAAGSAAAYYTRYLVEAPGEVPGVWAGEQAAALSLAGRVDGDGLLALLEGRDPVSGSPLGRPLIDRVLASGRVVKAVAGFDATFSAPKSVSVLWALTQDDRFLAAHDTAVRAVLWHLERFGSTTRQRVGGRLSHPDSQGLVMGVFRQTTSRSDDPQVHSHVVISAKVQTESGRWLALDARYLKQYQRMLGGLYQSVLRNELTHRLGVVWGPVVHGQAEVLGVPDGLLAVFSKRSVQIERAVAGKVTDFVVRQGRDPNEWELAAIRREAAADTRAHKSGHGVTELVARWRAEAGAIGWDRQALVDAVSAAGGDEPTTASAVKVDDVIAAVSTGGSSWNRAHVVSAVCDLAEPDARVDGGRWAAVIEQAADRILERCVELDPQQLGGLRRGSDGRSVWLEPTSNHITTDTILREEELVLAWAFDAQTPEPAPSTTVDVGGLDVVQADTARAVAGDDRLVLVVGPAGAGKTTTLRAAVADLDTHHRAVFGVAPSAKAARVLERETGVASDTLAKLLHEWSRDGRPPAVRYRLPAGATVLVDEAGMVATPALARLVTLAADQRWRLVLVGDPHQLQAVGRGGLFHELCTAGRTHQLARIHRFDQPWEPAASLLLRRGDPACLDTYIAHDRVHPGSFDEHLQAAAWHWLRAAAEGRTVAVVASTNDHVDALNAVIQRARLEHGQLDPAVTAPVAGGEQVMIGDRVVTRRNDRTITTTAGEPVRNRELWHVAAIGTDGVLTVSPVSGHGSVVLPADYTRTHVRLGYATTEHGVQGDTVDTSLELASAATTRRGLYVGLTRGRSQNHVCVITDTHDLTEARDILEQILANDRVDIPATTQRRTLATIDHNPHRRRPIEPRCPIPDWLADLTRRVHHALDDTHHETLEHDLRRSQLTGELARAERDLDAARQQLAPYRPALDTASTRVQHAQQRVWATYHQTLHGTGRHRRAANHDHRDAQHALADAKQQASTLHAVTAPARDALHTATARVGDLRGQIHMLDTLHRWDNPTRRADQLHTILHAVDQWERWASGAPVPPEQLGEIIDALRSAAAPDLARCDVLAATIERWARAHGIGPTPAQNVVSPQRAPSLGIDL